MSIGQSYIEINATTLRNACEDALNKLYKDRAERLEKEVSNLMNKRFFPCKSREDAIECLKTKQHIGITTIESKYEYIVMGLDTPFDNEEEYKSLKNLAETAIKNYKTTVNLSREDNDIIWRFIK